MLTLVFFSVRSLVIPHSAIRNVSLSPDFLISLIPYFSFHIPHSTLRIPHFELPISSSPFHRVMRSPCLGVSVSLVSLSPHPRVSLSFYLSPIPTVHTRVL